MDQKTDCFSPLKQQIRIAERRSYIIVQQEDHNGTKKVKTKWKL